MLKHVARFLLWIMGWKVEGKRPELSHCVIVAAPHTSYWDGPLMVMMNFALGMHVDWMVKHTAFRFPFRWTLRWLGAVPVERHHRTDVVQQAAAQFQIHDELHLLIAPEGTRSHRQHWKSGFYHIAQQAKVPIALSYLNYRDKCGGFGPTIEPGGDLRADMDRIRSFYEQGWAKYPEKMGPIRLAAEDDPAAIEDAA